MHPSGILNTGGINLMVIVTGGTGFISDFPVNKKTPSLHQNYVPLHTTLWDRCIPAVF